MTNDYAADDTRRWLALADDFRERLYEYAVDDEPMRFASVRRDAWVTFFGPLVPPNQLPDDHPDWDAFDDWFIFDFRLDNGATPYERYMQLEAGTLSAEERALGESWRDDCLGVFAVQSTGTGQGAVLRNLADERTFTVPNVPLSRRGNRWDHLIGRLVPVGNDWGFAAPPRHLIPALVDSLPADFTGREPPAADRHARAIDFWRVVRRLAAEHPAVPVTDEGDPVRLSRADYLVSDSSEVARRLGALRYIEDLPDAPQGERWFGWIGVPLAAINTPNAEKLQLGTLRLTETALSLESLSAERLARGRRLIEPALEGLAEHQGDVIGQVAASAPSAEDTARSRLAGQAIGGILQAASRNERLQALTGTLEGSEAAVMLEQFDPEPFLLLAGLHHPGQIGLSRVWLRGGLAGAELSYERPDGDPYYASARLREMPQGWRLEAIRPGRLGQRPSSAIGDDEQLRLLWSGEWQWAPNGSAANHPVLGIALARLHRTGRPILAQVMAIRLWNGFIERVSPDPGVGDEDWAIGLGELTDWQTNWEQREPLGPQAQRIRKVLGLVDDDPRYSVDLPVMESLQQP